MKGRIVFVEHRPEVAERFLVATLAEGPGAASEMGWRQQWPAPHRPQGALGTGDAPVHVGLVSRQTRHQPGDQLAREPILRLIGVSGQPRCLRPRGGGR